MMEQREKLIELLKQDPELFFDKMGSDDYENLADHLLANGVVVVLPCRCGECAYCEGGNALVNVLWCKHLKIWVSKDSYCSGGKRKRR